MTKRPIRLLPLVEIEWVDSNTFCDHAWFKPSDVKGSMTNGVSSVGYILEETNDNITLVASISVDGGEISEVGGVKVIPKVSIVKRRTLRK